MNWFADITLNMQKYKQVIIMIVVSELLVIKFADTPHNCALFLGYVKREVV